MKVLIIDPWCNDQYEVYSIGLCEGLSSFVDLTICTNYFETRKSERYTIRPTFFRYSEKMQRGFLRNVVRGIEYIIAYIGIIKLVKKERFDIVHVQWAFIPSVDVYFLSKLKKYTNRLVYTSHNVIPHIDGNKSILGLKKLHQIFDIIILHGNNLKKEYLEYFPEDGKKIRIQRHGVHLTQKTTYYVHNVNKELVHFVESKEGKLCLFAGVIFYNKGADRPIKYWIENKSNSKDILLVAGIVDQEYEELRSLIPLIEERSNIMYYPHYLNEDEFSYILDKCDFVTIPYRHASMSGLVYSAAAFSKPILFTRTGAIEEYVDRECGIGCENNDEEYFLCLSKVLSMKDDELSSMGANLHQYIYSNYDWKTIASKLVKEIYIS